MVDAYSVKRGRNCGCICPSCSAPLIAKHGAILVWHFAHATKHSGAEDICAYSALVSIRLMVQQILADTAKISIPPRPHETGNAPRDVLVESIKIDTSFEGSAVDAVATIKSTPLVVYLTYKSRPVPEALFAPDSKKAGVLEINLEKLWRLAETSESHRVGKGYLEHVLVENVDAKKWIFHPAQRRSVKLVHLDQILAPNARIPSDPAQDDSTRLGRPAKLARWDQNLAPKDRVPNVPTKDDSPLLVRFECKLCSETWYAGGNEADANQCAICKQHSGIKIR